MAEATQQGAAGTRRAELTPAQRVHFDAVRETVRRLARRLVSRKGSGDAEDLEQIGMEIACKRAPEYRPGSTKFFSFIYLEVRLAMIRAIYAEKRQRWIEQAAHSATREVVASLEVGDIFEEDGDARLTRHDDARYAMIGAAIIGMTAQPPTPEELLMSEQERKRIEDAVNGALASLDPIDRWFVVRCAMEDSTVAEAARAVALEYDQARYRFLKAMAAVGRKLGAKHAASSG